MGNYFLFGERLMDMRVREELEQAEKRRLQHEARKARPGQPSRQRYWILRQLGSLFVLLGMRPLPSRPSRSLSDTAQPRE
jgi:hypothetical protein